MCAVKAGQKAPSILSSAGASPAGEATESIVFAVAVVFLSPNSAQKSRVKPQNHLTHSKTATSTWRIRYTQNVILDIRDQNSHKPDRHKAN
jgi:hypothetical protein